MENTVTSGTDTQPPHAGKFSVRECYNVDKNNLNAVLENLCFNNIGHKCRDRFTGILSICSAVVKQNHCKGCILSKFIAFNYI